MKNSIIIPVYNSQNSLKELVERIVKSMSALVDDFEVILVDDFSKDGSWKVLQEIKRSNEGCQIKVIRFSKNYGQHNATLCGMRYARGQRVVTLDDDLQHRPEDISLLIERMKERDVDIMYGVPIDNNHRSNFRNYSSKFWNLGTRNLDESYGGGSSFRVIRKEVIESVIQHRQSFVFIDEMLNWYTDIIDVTPVAFEASRRAKSGYTKRKLFFLGINLALFYSSVPLKLMTYLGLLLSFASLILGIFFIYKKVFLGTSVPGYTSIIVAISFSTSLILMCLGIIGQYLGKIHSSLNNKPTYAIKEQLL